MLQIVLAIVHDYNKPKEIDCKAGVEGGGREEGRELMVKRGRGEIKTGCEENKTKRTEKVVDEGMASQNTYIDSFP